MNPVILDALQQRFGTADWTQYQVIRGQKYDFIRYPNLGTNQLSFFSIPIGGVDPNSQLAKTLEQTNLVKNASFGQEYFAITQIRTYAGFLPKSRQNGTIATDVNSVWNGYSASDANAVEALNNLFNRGILRGDALARYVRTQVGGRLIEDMPLPLGILATDLNSGQEIGRAHV